MDGGSGYHSLFGTPPPDPGREMGGVLGLSLWVLLMASHACAKLPTPFTSVLGVFSSQSSIPSKFILCMVLKPSDINLLYTHTLENELILCRRQIC